MVVVVLVVVVVVQQTSRAAVDDAPFPLVRTSAVRAMAPHASRKLGAFHAAGRSGLVDVGPIQLHLRRPKASIASSKAGSGVPGGLGWWWGGGPNVGVIRRSDVCGLVGSQSAVTERDVSR